MIKVRNLSFNIRECGAVTAIYKTEVSILSNVLRATSIGLLKMSTM